MRRTLIRRLARNGGIVAALIFAAVAVGATGYHWFDNLPWLDAVLNAAMILSGMGQVNPLTTTPGKVFASLYALFSGIVFVAIATIIVAPVLHRLLHHFHLEGRK